MGLKIDMALFEATVKKLEDVYTQDQINNTALREGGEVIKMEMLRQAMIDPKVGETKRLIHSIMVGSMKSTAAGTLRSITVGVHSGAYAFYAAWVEFGHGGPRSAPPHPYVVPAFDRKVEQAYQVIKQYLANAKIT